MRRFAIYAAVVAMLGACSGGGGNNDGGSGTQSPGAQSAQTVTTDVGSAKVTAIFLPGVIRIQPSSATRLSDTNLLIVSMPDGFSVGTVFTWADRAYVVTAMAEAGGNGTTVSVRPARFDEVLSDLTVKGDLSLADMDADSLTWDDGSDVLQSQPTSTGAPEVLTPKAALPNTQINCEMKKDSQAGTVTSEISCAISRTFQGTVALTGKVGLRDLKYSNLDFRYRQNIKQQDSIKGTLFFQGGAKVLTGNNGSTELKYEPALVRVKVAVPDTLGFLHVDLPVVGKIDLPLMKLEVSASLDLPFTNDTIGLAGTLNTPIASVNTAGTFKYEIPDGFLGVQAGIELNLSKEPIRPVEFAFGGNDANEADNQLLSVGAYYKYGVGGLLSVEGGQNVSGICFKYSLRGQAGASFGASVLSGGFSTRIEGVQQRAFANPALDGQSGTACEASQTYYKATYRQTECNAPDALGTDGPSFACSLGGYGFDNWGVGGFYFTADAVQPNFIHEWGINSNVSVWRINYSIPPITKDTTSFSISGPRSGYTAPYVDGVVTATFTVTSRDLDGMPSGGTYEMSFPYVYPLYGSSPPQFGVRQGSVKGTWGAVPVNGAFPVPKPVGILGCLYASVVPATYVVNHVYLSAGSLGGTDSPFDQNAPNQCSF